MNLDGDAVFCEGHLSSSLHLLPTILQFRCMKYLVFLTIYKIFLYPLGVQKISIMFWSGIFSA